MKKMPHIMGGVVACIIMGYLVSFLSVVAVLPREDGGELYLVKLQQVVRDDGETREERISGYWMASPYGTIYAPLLQLARLPFLRLLLSDYYVHTHGDLMPILVTNLDGEKYFCM